MYYNYLSCNISYTKDNDAIILVNKFNYMCGTIKRCLKTHGKILTKLCKTMAVSGILYGSENWTLPKR